METKNEKLKMAKSVATMVTGISTAYVVTQAVNQICPFDGNILKRVVFPIIGGSVLSWMVSDAAESYVEKKIDDAIEKIEASVTVEIEEVEEA